MRLTNISASGLKGGSFSHELSPFTAVIGPNQSQKSAVYEAIRLLFIGHIPELGKKDSSTFELGNEQELRVGGVLDDGTTIRRWWTRDSKGKISSHYEGPLRFAAGSAMPLLDPEAYFAMSDRERVAYVFNNVTLPDSCSAESIISDLRNVTSPLWDSEQYESAKTGFLDLIQRAFAPGRPVQEALDESVGLLKEQFTIWNARQRDTAGAVRVMTELKLREEQNPDSSKELERQLSENQQALDAINVKIGAQRQREETRRRQQERKSALEKLLAAPEKDYGTIADLEQELSELQTAPAGPTAKEQAEATKVNKAEMEWRAANTELKKAQENVANLTEALEGFSQLTECPTCKARGKGWRAGVEESLKQQLDEATAKVDDLANTVEVAKRRALKENERRADLSRRADEARTIKGKILDCSTKLANLKTARDQEAHARQYAKEKLDALNRALDKSDVENADDLATEQQRLAEKSSQLRERLSAVTSLERELQRASEAKLEHLTAKARMEVVKALGKMLAEKREQLVTEAFGPLLAIANALGDDILKSPIALRDGTIGRWDGAVWIPHRVFSGTEKACAYLGISAGLSVRSPIKIGVLDEIGRLDRGNQEVICLNLEQMCLSGVFDQVLVIGTNVQLPGGANFPATIIRTDANE